MAPLEFQPLHPEGSSDGARRRKLRASLSAQLRSRAGRVLLVAAAVASLLLAGLGWGVSASPETVVDHPATPRILAVQTVSIRPVTSYHTAREYTGTIVARRTSQLGFELAGKLQELYVDEGDSVTSGTALAQLDTEHLKTRRRQMVARQTQAAAKLAEMVAGPRAENIAAARARVESLQAQVELLKLQTARQKRLVTSKATSQAEYEQVAFGLKSHQAQYDEARHKLDELLNGTRQEQLAAQRAVVAELDAVIADIDVDLRKSTLKAPFDGTIARRLADDGTVVEGGQPIFRLVEAGVLEAWIGLPIQAAERLDGGSVRRLKIGGRYLEAVVARRRPEVDPATRTRTTVLRLADSAIQHIVHGQVVRLELDEVVQANGYWLPSTALAKGARGLWTAFVVVEADRNNATLADLWRVERRQVEVLHTETDRVLVRGTLNSGDRVVINGTHRVVPGQLVRLSM